MQQNRDAVLNSIDQLAISGYQTFAQWLSLHTAVCAPQTAAGDRTIDRVELLRLQQLQGLACVGATKDIKQSAIHDLAG